MLEVADLVAGYRGRAVTRLPDLQLRRGEAAILSGNSGSGKTTALLAIAGLAQRLAGTVRIGGTDVGGLGRREGDRFRGRHVGMVFQDFHLVAGLSAIDNLLLAPFAVGAGRDRRRAMALLEQLGLAHRRDARAETLSRGEAQRTAIARAIMNGPDLILADEPTASLDDEACETVATMLREATRESGAALLVATHDARVRAFIPVSVRAEPA